MAAFFSRPAPAVVKIVAPPRPDGSPAPQAPQDQNQLKLCSNYAKFGFCQFEGVGCIFYHPPHHERSESDLAGSSSSDLSQSSRPSSQPRQNVNAPVFVPKSALSSELQRPKTPSSSSLPSPPSTEPVDYDPYDPYMPNNDGDQLASDLLSGVQNMQLTSYDHGVGIPSQAEFMANQASAGLGLESYYQMPIVRQPLNYHLYSPSSHNSLAQKTDQPPQHSFFISDTLRQELTQRAEAIRSMPFGLAETLPEELQGYHSLIPLDTALPSKDRRPNFGMWHSFVYKAASSNDGLTYVLRRIENYRLTHEAAFGVIEQWSKIQHPNIVSVREAFTTRAFNDNSLVVAYDYHPNAMTLLEAHVKYPNRVPGSSPTTPIPENVLWSYITQIGVAIKAVHAAGLAVRMIDASKILLTGKNRIRIGSCGIADVLAYDARQDIHVVQQEDLIQFGRLLLVLCCKNPVAANNLSKSMEIVSRNYSGDLKTLIIFLISKPVPLKSVSQIFEIVGGRLLTEVEALEQQTDFLEGELDSELENGRLVRLLSKLGFINERPEFDRDPRWSETGDRYIIKLFRDYVFHQVDETGSPVVNLSHVLTCLNKLDAGTEERIMLVSRDEQSCLVVSYKELKACIESTFSELSRCSS